MFSEKLFRFARRWKTPYRFHLLAAIFTLHIMIVECVLMTTALLRLCSPQYNFCRVSECSASQIRRRIGFFPNDVIQQTIPVLQESHAYARIDMQSAADPDSASRLQDPLALRYPLQIELMVSIYALTFIPFPLIYTHHFPCGACDAIIRQLIRRISPDTIHAFIGQLRQQVKCVVMV